MIQLSHMKHKPGIFLYPPFRKQIDMMLLQTYFFQNKKSFCTNLTWLLIYQAAILGSFEGRLQQYIGLMGNKRITFISSCTYSDIKHIRLVYL